MYLNPLSVDNISNSTFKDVKTVNCLNSKILSKQSSRIGNGSNDPLTYFTTAHLGVEMQGTKIAPTLYILISKKKIIGGYHLYI